MGDITAAVAGVLRRVAEQRGRPAPAEFRPDQTLTGDLGLKSLDLAQAVALLDRQLKADPFTKLVPITSVRTVGDLCAAYRQALDTSAAPPPATADGVSDGTDRAARRREAAGRRPTGEGGHG